MAVLDGARGLTYKVIRCAGQCGAGNIGVHGDAVPASSPEQGMDRRAEPLAENIPQALFKGAQRMYGGPIVGTGFQSRGQPFDLSRVLSFDVPLDVLQRTQYRTSGRRWIEFAQSVHPLVGPDVYEHPVMLSIHVHRVEIDSRYAHGSSKSNTGDSMRSGLRGCTPSTGCTV